ncbi:MAG TPA: DUF1592 domain-containing protein [Candidatus Latescibacteria bacterium]|nr:DUF1592 domain-containing protein [Candidatus Latescibacterota bacterium]
MTRLYATGASLGVLLALAGHVRDPVVVPWDGLHPFLLPAAATSDAPDIPHEVLTGVVRQYCVRCHNDQALRGNLSLEAFEVEEVAERAETGEKMINKLRAGMMPPPGARRPSSDTLLALVETLEGIIDEASARDPDPGFRTFQRLNRTEYANAIEDLLGLKVDAGQWLPLDSYLANFDNMAVAQTLSATLLDAYLNAANEVSRLALGEPNAAETSATYRVSVYESQHAWERVEGAPFGTRGGMVKDHYFPADGEYVFRFSFWAGDKARYEDLDISIDGERVALLELEVLHIDADLGPNWIMETEPISIHAGHRRVAAAFIEKVAGPYDDILQPHESSLAGTRAAVGYGVTLLPHLRDMTIVGPRDPRGVSEASTRGRIFTCRPTSPDDAQPCAEKIISRLATEAYRRPLSDRELEDIMSSFYDGFAETDGFEVGVRTALEAILASPHFVFRIEPEPAGVQPGESYRVSDLALASRLSFFLWASPPDNELVQEATSGRLADPRVLEAQVTRMLQSPKAEALATRFAAQWLRLQDLDLVRPDAFWFPDFTEQLANNMRRETELFFHNLVKEDRSIMELYAGEYTFLNQRLAEHYGIEGLVGDHFRRVEYPEAMQRRGLLGHGSILMLTSVGTRTSPVLRGKWVMEVLMNTPPPPPPPGIPDLEETEGTKDRRLLTTRERLELHRANPVCSSCHRFMDPIGLALDNFDVTGRWRIRENGSPLDTRSVFYDGSEIENPIQLSDVLLKRPLPLLRTFTTNLLAYALGRRIEYYDQPTVRAIVSQAAENDYRISSFIMGVVESTPFQMKRASTVEEAGRDTDPLEEVH